MKICDIAQFYSPLSGGVKRYIHDKKRFLAQRPGGQHVLIIPSHRDAVTRTATATVYEIKSPRLIGSRSYRVLIARRRILEAVAAEKPDLIEVGDPYRTAWLGLLAGRRLGIPVVAFYHSDFPRAISRTVSRFAGPWFDRLVSRPIQRYLRRLYNRMDATVVASRRLCDILEACGLQRIVHISLGTDVDTFYPRNSRDRIRAELAIPDGTAMLLFVGRLAREKNIRNLIASLDHQPPDCPPHHLVLVGDGELHDYVCEEAAQRPNLSWLPYCESAHRLADLYSAADLFVHAGKYETFGIVALEAQACGTPVMAVREGGLEEAVAGEDPPILASDGSPEAIAAAIRQFLRRGDSPEKRAARRERIVRHLSIAATFERLFALYEHLIAGKPAETFIKEHPEPDELHRPPVSTR